MRLTIKLNDQLGFIAVKVGSVGPKRMLATKLHALALPVPQQLPQIALRTISGLSQIASKLNRILATHTKLHNQSCSLLLGEKGRG